MAYKSSYELHHHFPKVAEESGFVFNTHRPRKHVDWNKIRLIDIENIIRERRFVLIEQHLNDILNCVLESEFDVRILDEGVLKMFRLAQLAVEYQQFCRHYLDRSVFVLREELNALAQDLNVTKKDLQDREEELRKMRRKSKHTYRTPLPYGNDNIATMILKTLANKSDMFPSTSNGEALQYNKCTYCDKIFLNQLYLRSHVSRRHPNVTEVPQKDITENIQNNPNEKESSKLNDEILALKSKLNEMESFITRIQSQENAKKLSPEKNHETTSDRDINITKKTKDAEVSTNNEDYLMDKIEEWKKEESEKYNKEISLLRTQIFDTINSLKDKEVQKPLQNDSHLIEQLHSTIEQQGNEILALKQELIGSKLISKNETEKKRESEAQMSYFTKRAEAQSKQYESLLQKLNDVAQEAHESRALAEAEKERSAQLQALLQQSLTKKRNEIKDNSVNNVKPPDRNSNSNVSVKKSIKKKSYHKTNPVSDRKTLDNLHRKAQELLSIGSTSSSDVSSASTEKAEHADINKLSKNILSNNTEVMPDGAKEVKPQRRNKPTVKDAIKTINHVQKANFLEDTKIKEPKLKKQKSISHANVAVQEESSGFGPGSPIKVVRAKITEEVNNRLVSVGVDPLKSRLPQTVFQKQRTQLQEQHESKSKKNPTYQKVKHSILAYLDSTTSDIKKEVAETQDYISPTKMPKTFSLTSVISNVKSKALSLVKSNDNSKVKRSSLNAEVAKRAMSLLKTPPGSTSSSPAAIRGAETKSKADPPERELKRNSSNNKMFHTSEAVSKDKEKPHRKVQVITTTHNDSDDDKSNDSEHKYYNSAIIQQPSNSVESLIKSPARPSSATADYTGAVRKFTIDSGDPKLVRTQSAANTKSNSEVNSKSNNLASEITDNSSSDEVESLRMQFRKSVSVENIQSIPKQTKGVLKNASSTSSLNKKKVLFDMEAIQMKSVSASPSQSITDKSDANEKFELGLVNLDGEEWDISSIENEPLKNDTRIQINTRTSPKIAELKQTIESQLARRNDTPSTARVGGVDVLGGPMGRAASLAGSNTSLGSSILDDSEGIPIVNNKAFVKPKVTEKYDSELDISEYSIDGMLSNKKGNESF